MQTKIKNNKLTHTIKKDSQNFEYGFSIKGIAGQNVISNARPADIRSNKVNPIALRILIMICYVNKNL